MKKKLQCFTLLIFLLFFIVREAEAFRCGQHLILEGDHQFEVLSKCGEPAYTNRYYDVDDSFYNVQVDVMESWFYNFGPRRFSYSLLFRNGELEDIEVKDYGY